VIDPGCDFVAADIGDDALTVLEAPSPNRRRTVRVKAFAKDRA